MEEEEKIEKAKNTSMNEKNIFDKLYSTIMEGDDDFDMSDLDAGLEGGEDEFAGDL